MLYFDTNEVNEQFNGNSALSDIHGYFVFRDNFINSEKKLKEENMEYLHSIEQAVFENEQESEDIGDWVDLVLQSETEKYVKNIETITNIEKTPLGIYGWIIGTVFIAGILFVAIKKRKREDKDGWTGRNQDLENQQGKSGCFF